MASSSSARSGRKDERRQIKCHMLNSEPPCTRCRTRDQPCTIAKSVRTLLDDDRSWQERMEQRMTAMEAVLSNTIYQNSRTSTAAPAPFLEPLPTEKSGIPHIDVTATSPDLSCSLGAFPASSVHGLLHDDGTHPASSSHVDTRISKTVTSNDVQLDTDAAQAYFQFFQMRLNPLIYGVLLPGDSIQSVHQRSTLLAISLCATAAYCTCSNDYSSWLDRLRALVVEKTFSNHHTFDDVRALCVGAFWIDELATALNALAVRISSELNLHRCTTKMPHIKRACYDRTRLYYLVYIVDHCCSLTFGRPPLTHEIKNGSIPRQLLQCEFAQWRQSDLELVADFELWSITTSVFDKFGADIENRNTTFIVDLQAFESEYDTWLNDWTPVLSPLTHLLATPSTREAKDAPNESFKNSLLAAKVFLFSHVFRGPGQKQDQPPIEAINSNELRAFALRAIDLAIEFVRAVTEQVRCNSFFEIIPSYFGLMTAFASMILHRVSELSHEQFMPASQRTACIRDLTKLRSVLRESSKTLDTVDNTSSTSIRPLYRLAGALDRLLDTADSRYNGPLTAGEIEQQSSIAPAIDYLHSHSPYPLIRNDLFTNEFSNISLPFFDSDNLDWLNAEILPVTSTFPDMDSIDATGV